MNRSRRNHNTDLWGHANGLPSIHVGNYMCLESSNHVNSAPLYGETLHKPISGKVVSDDKILQLNREREFQRQNWLHSKREEMNITNPQENYQWSTKSNNMF